MADFWIIPAGVGYTMLALGSLVAAINFYLAFLRYPIHQLLGRPYRNISILPGIGTVFVAAAALSLHESTSILVSCFVLLVLDTGGFPWFIGVMAWYRLRPPHDHPSSGSPDEPRYPLAR